MIPQQVKVNTSDGTDDSYFSWSYRFQNSLLDHHTGFLYSLSGLTGEVDT